MNGFFELSSMTSKVLDVTLKDGATAKSLVFQVKVFPPPGTPGPEEVMLPAVAVPPHLSKAFLQQLLMAMAAIQTPESGGNSEGPSTPRH